MLIDPITSVASITSELEAGWKLFDDLYASFDRGDSWTALSPKLPEVQDMKVVHV